MGKIKVGFLIPRLGISDRGAEIFSYNLARYLKKNFEITLWVRKSNCSSKLISELENIGIKLIYTSCIPADNFLITNFNILKILKKVLTKIHLNPDEVEMLTFSLFCLPSIIRQRCSVLLIINGAWGCFVAKLVQLLIRKPFIYISQGGIDTLAAFFRPDLYVAINKEIERYIKIHFPHIDTYHIPNGVDINRFTPFGAKSRISLGHPLFLSVGALIPAKRIDLTIKAVAKLPKGSLIVIGDGPFLGRLNKLSEKLLGRERSLFLKVPHVEMPRYYRAADVFTLSSKNEPFGIVYLEALASGLPVVANDEENIRFITGHAGILCNTSKISEYSGALWKASKIELGNTPRRQARKFSWDVISTMYSKIILKMCGEKN